MKNRRKNLGLWFCPRGWTLSCRDRPKQGSSDQMLGCAALSLLPPPKAASASYCQKKRKKQFFIDFLYFFGLFSIYLAPSGAKYCEKGLAAIGKSLGKGLGRIWEGFGQWPLLEKAKLSSRDQVGC